MIVDSDTWKRLWSGAKEADFGGIGKFPIVDPIHLIAMKLHSAKQPDREEYFKDLNDIVEIMLAQRYNLEDSEIADIISRHETDKLKPYFWSSLKKETLEPETLIKNKIDNYACSDAEQISLIYRESEVWLTLDWVKEKLEKRWEKIPKLDFEPFAF